MTNLNVRQSFEPTSAAGAMFKIQKHEPVLISSMFLELGTSAAFAATPDIIWQSPRVVAQTTVGAVVPSAQPIGAAIGELRRLSGLTWEQLARIFSVSRRSLHFWASGKPMAPGNEEHLQRVLAVIRKIDRGSASANRTALLGVCENGSIPFDLLVAREYDSFVSMLGSGETRRVAPSKISEKSKAARAPRPPEELVGALQDQIHPTSGPLLAGKSIAKTRRK